MTTRDEFLKSAGWDCASCHDFPADWSTRSFARVVRRDGQSAILMESVPDSDPRALAGHKISDFISLEAYLRLHHVRVPSIYHADPAHGFLLVEDFGDVSLHHVFERVPSDLNSYYAKAVDLLCDMHAASVSNIPNSIPDYFASHIYKGRRRLFDWYLPAMCQRTMSDDFIDESLSILQDIDKQIPPIEPVFLHGDFHPHNIMVLSDGSLGLIDFQGGLKGPAPYDLVNLLRDARRIVPDAIQDFAWSRICDRFHKDDIELYKLHYALRSFDFHARVIGQAIKLALNGKEKLLSFLPHLEFYISQDLNHPLLSPLADCLKRHGFDFNQNLSVEQAKSAQKFIRNDAF